MRPLVPLLSPLADSSTRTGPCQFPTLGFVVDQYERVQAFVPEPFWFIHVGLVREDATTSFSWRRGRLYDHDIAEAIYSIVEDDPVATVSKWETKPTQKWCVQLAASPSSRSRGPDALPAAGNPFRSRRSSCRRRARVYCA